jgi:hypothetical protein
VLHRSGDAVDPHTYDQEETATPKYTEIRRNMTTPPNTEDIQALEIQELGDAVKRLTKGKCSDLHRIKAKVILHAWGGGGDTSRAPHARVRLPHLDGFHVALENT